MAEERVGIVELEGLVFPKLRSFPYLWCAVQAQSLRERVWRSAGAVAPNAGAWALRGMREDRARFLASRFAQGYLKPRCRADAHAAAARLQRRYDRLFAVTSLPQWYIAGVPLPEAFEKVFAPSLDVREGRLTGQLLPPDLPAASHRPAPSLVLSAGAVLNWCEAADYVCVGTERTGAATRLARRFAMPRIDLRT